MLRVLEPYFANMKKRVVKSPKIYLQDNGLLHALLDIKDHNDLLGIRPMALPWLECSGRSEGRSCLDCCAGAGILSL